MTVPAGTLCPVTTTDWDTLVQVVARADPPGAHALWPALVLVATVILVPSLRRWGRALGTIVHESGHAVVGMLVGRRFHGFTVGKDLSGAAVTSGRERGPGRVLTTWAGYPAPAALGAGLVIAALSGWAGAVTAAGTVALLLLLVMARSWRTGALVLLAALLTGLTCWFGDAVAGLPLRAGLVVGVGLVLLLVAWDSLVDVARSRDRTQDPGTLAALTHLPSWFWIATWVVADGAATWAVWRAGAGLLL